LDQDAAQGGSENSLTPNPQPTFKGRNRVSGGKDARSAREHSGRATGLAGYAIAISDFVIIPVRGSNPDAKQAFRHMGLLKTQERLTKRAIPFAMLFTQTSPALRPKTQRFIERRLADEGAPVFEAQLVDREAYRAMLSFGGTVAGLAGKGVSGLPAAVANADAFVDELLARLSNGNKPIEREEVACWPTNRFAIRVNVPALCLTSLRALRLLRDFGEQSCRRSYFGRT
jgi:hypothetical protein